MQENKNLQDCNIKSLNIVYKSTVTSTDNNTKKALNNIYTCFDTPLSHNNILSLM